MMSREMKRLLKIKTILDMNQIWGREGGWGEKTLMMMMMAVYHAACLETFYR